MLPITVPDLERHGYKTHYNQRCRHVVLRFCIAAFGLRAVLSAFREIPPTHGYHTDLQYLTNMSSRPMSAFTFRRPLPLSPTSRFSNEGK